MSNINIRTPSYFEETDYLQVKIPKIAGLSDWNLELPALYQEYTESTFSSDLSSLARSPNLSSDWSSILSSDLYSWSINPNAANFYSMGRPDNEPKFSNLVFNFKEWLKRKIPSKVTSR